MSIVERTRPYEALFRWQADGGLAAHLQEIVELRREEDGVLLSARLEAPRPLALAGAGFEAVTAAIDRGLAAELARVTAERDALAAALADRRGEAP